MIQDDDVGEEAGFQAGAEELGEVCVSRGLGIGVEGLVEGEGLLGVKGGGAGFVLAGEGGIEGRAWD